MENVLTATIAETKSNRPSTRTASLEGLSFISKFEANHERRGGTAWLINVGLDGLRRWLQVVKRNKPKAGALLQTPCRTKPVTAAQETNSSTTKRSTDQGQQIHQCYIDGLRQFSLSFGSEPQEKQEKQEEQEQEHASVCRTKPQPLNYTAPTQHRETEDVEKERRTTEEITTVNSRHEAIATPPSGDSHE